MAKDPAIFYFLLATFGLLMISGIMEYVATVRLAKRLYHHHRGIWNELGRPGTTFFKGDLGNGYFSRTTALQRMFKSMPLRDYHRKLANDVSAQRYLRQHQMAGRWAVICMVLFFFGMLLGVARHERRADKAKSIAGQSSQAVGAFQPDHATPSNEIMKEEGPPQWRLPVEDFKIAKGFICLYRSKDLNWEYFDEKVEGEIVCTGFRLECAPIRVPGGAYGYDKEITQEPEVMIDVLFPFESLARLEDTTIPLGEPMETCKRELGSMYLFASHNEVRWQEIRFGKVYGDSIDLEIDLFLDVDYDTGTTQFRHTLKGPAKIEQRWEP